jgi:hypothetical protein
VRDLPDTLDEKVKKRAGGANETYHAYQAYLADRAFNRPGSTDFAGVLSTLRLVTREINSGISIPLVIEESVYRKNHRVHRGAKRARRKNHLFGVRGLPASVSSVGSSEPCSRVVKNIFPDS